MVVVALPPRDPAQLPPLWIHRFTVDQYHRMVEVGILSEEDPVELLEGLVVIKGHSTLAPAISVTETGNGNGQLSSPLPVRRYSG